MSDSAEKMTEEFGKHVKAAAEQVLTVIPEQFPNKRQNAMEVAGMMLSIFSIPDFSMAVMTWIKLGKMLDEGAKCTCDDEENHGFLRAISNIMFAHTAEWMSLVMRDMLEELDLPAEVVNQVVEAYARKQLEMMGASANVSTEVPDYVPADWEKKDDNGG